LDLIFKLFDKLFITVEVYEELSRSRILVKPLAKSLKKGSIEIMESSDFANLQEKYPELGVGELSVIASAGNKIAFIEDRKAEKIAEKEGLAVFNIPELLLVCKKKGLIDREEIRQIIEELKDKDRYYFKKEVEEILLR